MNSRPFWGPQTWENVVFFDLGDFSYPRILHSSAVSGRTSPTKYFQGLLELPRGFQKTGKTQGCFGCLMCVFFFSISSPHGHLSSWHTFLFANVSFILVFYFCCYVFLLCGSCVSSFFIFIFVVLFTFHSVVSLCCLLSWCDKNPDRTTKNISKFDCHLLLRCLHPHTFTWPR